jgi:hypothetical protein
LPDFYSSASLTNGNVVAELKVLNRVSGQETRTEKVEKVGHKEDNGVYIKRVTEEANLLPDVEEKLGFFCVVHVHNDVNWGNACTELRGMYLQCLSHQVDIVCGDGNQSWYFRYKNTQG